jgi:3',5'-cyclic AMP phosphodiesterase CpdA
LNQNRRLPQGRHLFSFVVVADTHVNETDETSRSPFNSNRLANNRARHVFSEIAAMTPQPAFVVHLGDMVHPLPSLPGFDAAASRFKEIVSQVDVPVHLVPGNHDIGDKTIDWMPAELVCDKYVDKYHSTFGRDYYAFDSGDVHGIVLNALLFNSGLKGEEKQKAWLDEQLAHNKGRVFVFLHYPPYVYEPGERSSYENIDEPARGWLLDRLRRPQTEAVFAGHVHNFWYDVVGEAEMYLLPSTAFLRHDFTEFYRVAPGDEHGRGDTEKYGYFVVDVHERGHVARLVRTHGQMLAAGDTPKKFNRTLPVHTKTSQYPRFGVELRHAWSEVVQIPATGGIEEFGRKLARNDYQLMALWEMGVKTLKVPGQDLLDPVACARARLMSAVGHEFIVTVLNVPKDKLVRQIRDSGVYIKSIELNISLQKCLERSSDIARIREQTGAAIVFSKLRMAEGANFDGQHFSHSIDTGLRLEELEGIRPEVSRLIVDKVFDGVTVRLDDGDNLLEAASVLDKFANDTGGTVLASVKLAKGNLATLNDDDFGTARKAAEALILSRSSNRVSFVFDTFMDVDRGYFPRNGFIDRRFNPRAAGLAVAALVASLPAVGAVNVVAVDDTPSGRTVRFEVGPEAFALYSVRAPTATLQLQRFGSGTVVDLLTQEVRQQRS